MFSIFLQNQNPHLCKADYSRYHILSRVLKYSSFCDCFVSFSTTPTRFTHVVTYVRIPFFVKDEVLTVYGNHISLVETWFGHLVLQHHISYVTLGYSVPLSLPFHTHNEWD